MTTYVGNSGVVNVGGTAVAEVTSFSVVENADRVEDTALGDSNRTYKAGLTDVTGTIEAHWDPDDASQSAMVAGAEVSLTMWPEGAGSGNPEWAVLATILSINSSVQFNEIVSVTFEWGAAGALTKGVQP